MMDGMLILTVMSIHKQMHSSTQHDHKPQHDTTRHDNDNDNDSTRHTRRLTTQLLDLLGEGGTPSTHIQVPR